MQTCGHDLKVLTERILSNNTAHYCYQCCLCKRSVGGFISKEKVKTLIDSGEKIESWDQDGLDRIERLRNDNFLRSREERERKQAERTTKWWQSYKQHLQSNDWTMKRNAVFRRSGGMCECCLTNRATEVHHLSYKNVGHEFLPELTATCNSCHSSAHEEYTND